MTIYPGGPGFAGTNMSPFWILLELCHKIDHEMNYKHLTA